MNNSHPKRKKSRDNPYTLEIENGIPYVSFEDSLQVKQKIELTDELYELFSSFELEDISQINERNRHTDKFLNSEDAVRICDIACAVDAETAALRKMGDDMLREAIETLSVTQRRRMVLYYFYGYTLQAIADIEGTTKMGIKNSIDSAKEKIKKFFEKGVYF